LLSESIFQGVVVDAEGIVADTVAEGIVADTVAEGIVKGLVADSIDSVRPKQLP